MQIPEILTKSKKKFEELYHRSKRKYLLFSIISFLLSFSTVSISAMISLSVYYDISPAVLSSLGTLIAILKSSEEIFKISRSRHENKRLILRTKLIVNDIIGKIIEFEEYFKNGEIEIIPPEFNNQSLYDFVRKHYDEVDHIITGEIN